MSNDRDARGLEDRVELFDRLFFCRSFHSKLSPVGGLRACAGPPGCTDRPALNLTSRHQSLGHAGRDDISEACPPASLLGPRGVEVRTKSALRRPEGTRSEIRSSP